MPEGEARWIEDPTRRHQLRWWNGNRWTEHVSDHGIADVDWGPAGPPQATTPLGWDEGTGDAAEGTRACPWCGETILAVARKCKHCGEYLEIKPAAGADPGPPHGGDAAGGGVAVEWQAQDATPSLVPASRVPAATSTHWCEVCQFTCSSERELSLHRVNVHRITDIVPATTRVAPRSSSYSGKPGQRQKLSQVGDRSEGSLRCPKCGSTQFTAKRSMKGKLIGGTIGVASLGVLGPAGAALAPKSRVKCVACGLMFKRG